MKRNRVIAVALLAVLALSMAPVLGIASTGHPFKDANIKQCILRWYNELLLREPTASEVDHWFILMSTGVMNGKDAAYSFVAGPEFAQTSRSDTQYVVTLYRGLLNRQPAQSEISHWVNQMPSLGRIDMLIEILNSHEFAHVMAYLGVGV